MAAGEKIGPKGKRSGGRKVAARAGSASSPGATGDPAISPGGQGEDRIAEFLALSAREMADHMFGRPDEWLNYPNPHFGGRTPNEMIESGQEGRVRDLLSAATLGMF